VPAWDRPLLKSKNEAKESEFGGRRTPPQLHWEMEMEIVIECWTIAIYVWTYSLCRSALPNLSRQADDLWPQDPR
jgi:hypothetical protein